MTESDSVKIMMAGYVYLDKMKEAEINVKSATIKKVFNGQNPRLKLVCWHIPFGGTVVSLY